MATTPPILVGAYATTPPGGSADEASFYAALARDGAEGYEVPLLRLPDGSFALHVDEPTLFTRLFAGGQRPSIVLTCVPATMASRGLQPTFGLASDDDAGRAAAIALAASALAAVRRVHAAAGCRVVLAVEVHACGPAPRGSSGASLTASLATLACWDWEGAELVVEHCDALVEAHPPAKGFPLRIAEEAAAVRAAIASSSASAASSGAPPPARLGLAINWARSVLEDRDETGGGVIQHVLAAGDLLRGVVFSGCSGAPRVEGYGAWTDSHMPHDAAAPGSLLTAAAIAATLQCRSSGPMPPLLFLGAKITLQHGVAGPEERARVNADLVALIKAAL